MATWDAAPVIVDEPAKNYVAKQSIVDGVACTLIRYRADGLDLNTWERWRQDPTAIAVETNEKLTREVLADDDGHKCVHLFMKMPMMISNRSIVSCFYECEREDGWKALFHSSKGNDHIVAARQPQIKKDVVANNHLTYFQWKPYDGGLEVW